MSKNISDIKPAEIYADLSVIEIAEMLAEAAKVDALFQSGRISTTYLTDMATAAHAVARSEEDTPAAEAA